MMAGASATRRRKFFEAHPKCCFCGGLEAATTEDHIPARSLFLKRIWPTGYVFPACAECNNSTCNDEALMAWLVRIRITEPSVEEEKELAKYTHELAKRFPEIVEGMQLHSRVQSRRFLKDIGAPSYLPDTGEALYSMDLPDGILDVVSQYGVKLGKALHYLHTRRIVPGAGVVDAKVFTNANALSSDFPRQIFNTLVTEADIRRATNSLKGQFDYRYAVVEEGEASAFAISLGESMVILVSVFVDGLRHAQAQEKRRLRQMN